MAISSDQELFWKGEFGNDYIDRNQQDQWVCANVALFAKILSRTDGVNSVLELGSNVGLNLTAIRQLLPKTRMSAVEINEKAASILSERLPNIDVHITSILGFVPSQTWDLVFTKGVLIHIAPDKLNDVYQLMYDCSNRYILVSEYYNPSPVEVNYRGHADKLFKRDFAGEILDRFDDVKLIDYGFQYRRDPNFPQDDTTWFLLEKSSAPFAEKD